MGTCAQALERVTRCSSSGYRESALHLFERFTRGLQALVWPLASQLVASSRDSRENRSYGIESLAVLILQMGDGNGTLARHPRDMLNWLFDFHDLTPGIQVQAAVGKGFREGDP